MTQPAQISGHGWLEWATDNENRTGHCECGLGKELGLSRPQYRAHVASVVQAAQPQEVPAEQRVLTAEEIAYKATTHECGWAEYHINALVASKIAEAIAQPASVAKPAEDGLEARLMEILYMDANREVQLRQQAIRECRMNAGSNQLFVNHRPLVPATLCWLGHGSLGPAFGNCSSNLSSDRFLIESSRKKYCRRRRWRKRSCRRNRAHRSDK